MVMDFGGGSNPQGSLSKRSAAAAPRLQLLLHIPAALLPSDGPRTQARRISWFQRVSRSGLELSGLLDSNMSGPAPFPPNSKTPSSKA